MKRWWQRRTLKLRLALWFTTVAGAISLGLIPVVYRLIEHRLHVELDKQLDIDWNLVAAHLEADAAGRIQWRKESPATPNSPGYAATWFDVWSGDELLLSHWPPHGIQITHPPQGLDGEIKFVHTIALATDQPARTLQQPMQIGRRAVTLRVFRDESGLNRTLQEILIGFVLGVPVAALLAAAGGYVVAARALRPISAMAEQARQITSESLGQRLPNPNPHDELGQLATVFNQTLQRLEDSFESLRRFTADASHELRTPLTALQAVGEVALRESGDEEASRETIGSMLEEVQRLHDLIDSMLLLARGESGRSPLQLEPLRVGDLLAGVNDSLGVLAAEKQQTIEVCGDPDLVIRADRVLVRQALLNILHNAICYSPAGTKVAVRSFQRADHVIMEIADEGPGIAPDHQQKVFERFYRIDPARARAAGGAGLGLAIAKLSIERLGGSITLTSELGKGSRFQIILPAEPPAPPGNRQQPLE